MLGLGFGLVSLISQAIQEWTNKMRAKEFIKESVNGKVPEAEHQASVGMHIYDEGDGSTWASDYKLYRLGLAVACTDGTSIPEMDQQSWVGKKKTAHPYTKLESEMLKRAYLAVGADYEDANNGDLRSLELPDTNKVSPVAKKQKNQYGV